ncbi:ADP-ribosylglycohydrolase family protein [Kaistia dalseonensis]|uniref:ADP-ribosylglycohydrolase n=1 Tax=Kaistia dalseonensis TaxID=410840 RepID=A0ABU0H8T9_9HYPH|nr:ADP-ribosylglycohydrolase family protein [Kaistia dalseonensis]MCX5496130.1 ADP-ribosylglycohydrolase family protein [Kaistia dalseonensis]MDQ0438739.1 ADP-ribosylglycohydrolase [Kaistia dalseonensis]
MSFDPSQALAKRIYNVILSACLGDALGAPTESMYPDEILDVFGGRVTAFVPAPPRAPFSMGSAPGSLTDDATQMLEMARTLIAAKGTPTVDDAARGLIAWFDDPRGFGRFAGPTTRVAIERLKAGEDPSVVATPVLYSATMGTTNGAAMRAPVAGCVRPGDIEGAVAVAAILSTPTHNTQIAYAGAGAVAAAVAIGLGGPCGLSLSDAAFRGADEGERIAAKSGRFASGASVRRRLELAVAIGDRYRGDAEGCIAELEAVIGAGLPMNEAVPTAVGLAIAVGPNPWEAIVAAANIGNDCDTVALIAGSIAAAWSEDVGAPAEIVAELEKVNGLDLKTVAHQLAESVPA